MTLLNLPAQALILVGDGRKALFLRNCGTALAPELAVERISEQDNPPTREHVSDQAGRTVFGPQARHAGYEKNDFHEIAEADFAKVTAERLARHVQSAGASAIVIVAPPRTLAVLRSAWPRDIADRIVAEIPKDLTGHPVPDILRHLTD